jgi:hypothetical protein
VYSRSPTGGSAARGSGIDVEDKVGLVYELRDGFAVRISGYRDLAEALAELGSDA